jgi:NAD+--asparagine ADP-ribosyltransferase
MSEDPIKYATDSVMKSLDTVGEIEEALKDLTDSYKHEINKLKLLIQVYFSDEVQRDETPMGAMRRNQIRKELLDFADK